MGLLILWCVFGLVGAIILGDVNKSGIGCLLGFLLGPIGWIVAGFMRSEANRKNERLIHEEDQARQQRRRLEQQRAAEVRQQRVLKEKKRDDEAKLKRKQMLISGHDFALSLTKLADLHSANMISDEEFAVRKKKAVHELNNSLIEQDPIDFLSALVPLVQGTTLTQPELAEIKAILKI